MEPYERFEAWRLCHELVLDVYRLTRRFPTEERYGLTSQARRAAFSAAVNIVEGSAKRGRREFRRYLDISLGSLAEVGYVLLVARELEMAPAEHCKRTSELRRKAAIVTWKLYQSMQQ